MERFSSARETGGARRVAAHKTSLWQAAIEFLIILHSKIAKLSFIVHSLCIMFGVS